MIIHNPIVTGSLTVNGDITATGIISGIAANADSASYATFASSAGSATSATSASYAVSASHVIGGVDPFPYTGNAQINGGLGVSGSVEFAYEVEGAAAWSAGGALITARGDLAGAGTQTAGLAFGGRTPSVTSCTEEYDGSSWSAGGALITARFYLAGAGTQNAGLAFGGLDPYGIGSCTEEYTGASSITYTTFSSTSGAIILSQVSSSLNFADDAAAASGGVPLGGLYHSSGTIKIRLS